MADSTLLAILDTANAAETARLGCVMADSLPTGICIALDGTLGAGKTTLVQSFVAALGIAREEVTSPTFALLNTYPLSDRTIHHLDAYRIADDDEFLELGVDELFADPRATILIEWASKVQRCLPPETLWIEIEWHSEDARRIKFTGDAERWQATVDAVVSRVPER